MKKSIIALCTALLVQSTAFAAADLQDWALTDYESAARGGLLTSYVTKNDLSENITRSEFCDLLINLYSAVSGKEIFTPETTPFTDCEHKSVLECYALGIVSGRGDGIFDPDGNITREEMAKLIVNTLKSAERNLLTMPQETDKLLSLYTDSKDVSEWAKTDMSTVIKYSIMSGMSETELAPKAGATREQAIAVVNRVYTQYAVIKEAYAVPEFTVLAQGMKTDSDVSFTMTPVEKAEKYILIVKDSEFNPVSVVEADTAYVQFDSDNLDVDMKYTAIAGVRLISGKEIFSLPIDFIYKQETKPLTVIKTDNQTLSAKEIRVFPGGIPFQSEEEAAANMVTVTVDVWNVGADGEKYAAKKSLQVNRYLAEDVKKIFAEIFEHPSQFPIKSVGGYNWRTTAFGSVSQHSYGTCIDINPTENYYCYSDGTAITGTHWKPYEDIYSITPDGAVVAAFAKYGWIWGGSWDGSVIDYMHFSYLGK